MIKISIIVSVYNCEKYISRLVNCIFKQKYSNFELIIVNDGSTDNTLQYLRNFNDEKLILIDKKNTGVSDSRNEGLKRATGDLIIFLDADDYIEDNYFETIIHYFEKYPDIELLGFGYYSDVEDTHLNTISQDVFNYNEKYYRAKDEYKGNLVELWDKKMLYNIWNKVYKKSIIDKYNLRFFELNWGEDMDFNKKYIDFVNNFYISNKIFYHYIRERTGAATCKYRKDFFDIRKKEYIDFNRYFEENDIDYSEYIEFSSRRFVECVLGVIENVFSSDLNLEEKYNKISYIIHDSELIKALKIARPKTIKTKLMLMPLKCKNTTATMLMGKSVSLIKNRNPGLFNHLKNTR